MEFIKGMDISSLPESLNHGAKFLDSMGREREIFELLKENGVNSIRLRIWNEPENVPESGGYCNLEHTVEMAKKIKQAGMTFFLDFHYSDFWADPGKQEKPKAWRELGFPELKQAVYDYTRDVLLRLKAEEVYPEMVQIGNEIRSGMLFPDGEVPDFEGLVKLVNAGIHAVREVSAGFDTKVVIHLDQGGRYFYLRDWFDSALAAGLESFDVIGVSYYPFWHGTFAEFKEALANLINRYHKPVVIAETAHAWRLSREGFIDRQQEKIAGFPAAPEAQRKVIDLVMNITASQTDGMGLGIYYWEPVVLPLEGMGGWSSNMGIFDETGKALPALKSFRFERCRLRKGEIAKIYEPEKMVGVIGTECNLPDKIKVLYYDGSLREMEVLWEAFDNRKAGNITVAGRLPAIGTTVSADLQLVEKLESSHNFIPNAGFERGLDGWNVSCVDDRVKVELRTEFIEPFPAPPGYYIYVESPVNFKFTLSCMIEGLVPGVYTLHADYRGTNTTNVEVRLFAENGKGKRMETVIYPADEDWLAYQLKDIRIQEDTVNLTGNLSQPGLKQECQETCGKPGGKLKIGITIESPPVYGKIRRFTLTRQDVQEDE